MTDVDIQWFSENPERQVHIRAPKKTPTINKQRAVRYLDEEEMAYRHLGPHDPKLRRLILYKLPLEHPAYDPDNPQILKVPFLALEGETIPDTDEVLLPMLEKMMLEAQAMQG